MNAPLRIYVRWGAEGQIPDVFVTSGNVIIALGLYDKNERAALVTTLKQAIKDLERA